MWWVGPSHCTFKDALLRALCPLMYPCQQNQKHQETKLISNMESWNQMPSSPRSPFQWGWEDRASQFPICPSSLPSYWTLQKRLDSGSPTWESAFQLLGSVKKSHLQRNTSGCMIIKDLLPYNMEWLISLKHCPALDARACITVEKHLPALQK